ncbi:unnamed protein product [Vicia faba]|uniref:Uncharacterized protein n=1 Tax=Vicia faba TaxID=3906 RepID=A0AAV1AGP3_VICFA|nr:unnamed protein product [Vicia faba]
MNRISSMHNPIAHTCLPGDSTVPTQIQNFTFMGSTKPLQDRKTARSYELERNFDYHGCCSRPLPFPEQIWEKAMREYHEERELADHMSGDNAAVCDLETILASVGASQRGGGCYKC